MKIDLYKIKRIHWSDILIQMNAGSETYEYAKDIPYSQFWDECPIGENLIYFLTIEESTSITSIIKVACQCVKLVLPYLSVKETKPLQAIQTTERLLENKATIEEVTIAASASFKVASFAAMSFVRNVAMASAYVGYTATYVNNAANAANAVSYAIANVANAACVVDDVNFYKQNMRLKTANIIRSGIPMPTVEIDKFERLLSMKPFW